MREARVGKEKGRKVGLGASMELCLGLFCCTSCSAVGAVTAKDTSVTAPKEDFWAREEAAGGTTFLSPHAASKVSTPSVLPRSQATRKEGRPVLGPQRPPCRASLEARDRDLSKHKG